MKSQCTAHQIEQSQSTIIWKIRNWRNVGNDGNLIAGNGTSCPNYVCTEGKGWIIFFVDFQKLNAVTKSDSYPIPRMNECNDSFWDSLICSILDANRSYLQVEMENVDYEKTALTSYYGTTSILPLAIRIWQCLGTPLQIIYIILPPVKWQFVLIYLYNIVIFWKSADELIENVRTVISLLHRQRVKLNLRKCKVFT